MRALLITRSAASPAVRIETAAGGAPLPFSLRAVPNAESEIRAGLNKRGVRCYAIECTGLSPATAYSVTARVGGDWMNVRTTTLPVRLPPQGLTVAVATCYYDGYRLDKSLQASMSKARFDHAHTQLDWGAPAFHVWGGDNIYVDVPAADRSNAPVDHTLDRYLAYFLNSDYAAVRAIAPTFTTFDDHEYWNNYPQSQMWLSRSWDGEWKGYRSAARECVELFQNGLNLGSSCGDGFFSFDIAPLRFFFLDTRSFRTRDGTAGARRMLTPAAREALRAWSQRDCPGVLALGQPMWIGKGGEFDLNLPSFADDYAFLWRCLRESPYDSLVVSGDVHHSRVLKIAFKGSANRCVYEFVSSPACHIPGFFGKTAGDLGEIPRGVEHAGTALSASHYFGTDSPNTYGLLKFVPMGAEVRVGARFVEHAPKDRIAPAKRIDTVPRATSKTFEVCDEPNLFTLRLR
jgi:hypothetical protein